MNRRDFLKAGVITSFGLGFIPSIFFAQNNSDSFNVYDFITEGTFEYKGFHKQDFCDYGKCFIYKGFILTNLQVAQRIAMPRPNSNGPVSISRGVIKNLTRKICNKDYEYELDDMIIGTFENKYPLISPTISYSDNLALVSASGLDKEKFKQLDLNLGSAEIGEKVSILDCNQERIFGKIVDLYKFAFEIVFSDISERNYTRLKEYNDVYFGPQKFAGSPIIDSRKNIIGVSSIFYDKRKKLHAMGTHIGVFLDTII